MTLLLLMRYSELRSDGYGLVAAARDGDDDYEERKDDFEKSKDFCKARLRLRGKPPNGDVVGVRVPALIAASGLVAGWGGVAWP